MNKLEKRSGNLWEGRFKSSIVSSKEYLAVCCRYIEMNPLRAALVADPANYKWSSYLCKVADKPGAVVDFDSTYLAIGEGNKDRQKSFADYVQSSVPEYELNLIRDALQRGQLTGGASSELRLSVNLVFEYLNKKQGRPKKKFDN